MSARYLSSVLLSFVFGYGLCQSYQASFDVTVLYVPEVIVIDGKPTSYYELHLTNFAPDSLKLVELQIFNRKDSSIVATFDENALDGQIGLIGKTGSSKNIFASGSSGLVYIELPLLGKENFQIAHRIVFVDLSSGEKHSIQGIPLDLKKQKEVILGPPLGSGNWAAVYEPVWERGHRRVVYTVDGKARIPGRYAIDFIMLDNQGRYAKGDEDFIKNWYGYGVDVLAVSNGVVASARDDFSESPTLSGHPAHTPDKATGNYISIDIGGGHFTFYEHLKPGSIKVKTGQRVKKGEVIASLGFTGQTTGPHLHFHVANHNSPLGAEGLAYTFDQFTEIGKYSDFSKFGKALWEPTKRVIRNERPGPNTVIRFKE